MSNLKEVARLANVSISTVSRVINHSGKVNTKTRQRVKEAMTDLDYKPNRVAQRLRSTSGQSKLIGLIIPDIQNQFYSDIVGGIEDVTYGNDYAVILCNSDENPDKEAFYLNVLKSESVDGVILPPIASSDKIIRELMELGIAIICVDRKLAGESVDTVVIDNKKGAYLAVSHLIEKGHQHIALISSGSKFSSFKERQYGYEQALRDQNINIDPDLIRLGDQRRSQHAKKLTLDLLRSDKRPTAIFVTNNMMTLGVLLAISEEKLKIPDDISVIGFDDVEWAAAMHPPLTVVKQPGYEMGRRAGELFFERIEDPGREAVRIIMEPSLIVRESTAAPPEQNPPIKNSAIIYIQE